MISLAPTALESEVTKWLQLHSTYEAQSFCSWTSLRSLFAPLHTNPATDAPRRARRRTIYTSFHEVAMTLRFISKAATAQDRGVAACTTHLSLSAGATP
jgi:hypothetical protein